MPTIDKYLNMLDSGSSPKQVYLALKADEVSEIDSIRILRELFQFTLPEAKEVIVTSDLGVSSLEEYQERLFPMVIRAIEIMNADDDNSDDVSGKNT